MTGKFLGKRREESRSNDLVLHFWMRKSRKSGDKIADFAVCWVTYKDWILCKEAFFGPSRIIYVVLRLFFSFLLAHWFVFSA